MANGSDEGSDSSCAKAGGEHVRAIRTVEVKAHQRQPRRASDIDRVTRRDCSLAVKRRTAVPR